MRDELLRAAVAVLQQDGAAAFTLRRVTEEAGCSTTGVYTYFGGKQGLVDAIFVAGFDSFDDALSDALAGDDLEAAGRVYRRWALDNPTHYMVMFGRAVPEYEPSAEAMDRALASFVGLTDSVARVGGEPGAAERAYHLFATIHGYVMLEMSGMGAPTPSTPDELYERALASLTAVEG